MIWRDTQLKWYGGDSLLQDQELCDFVSNNDICQIRYTGDSEYLESIIGKKNNIGDMCIYLINSPFKFSEIVKIANQEIKKLKPNGILYLSINKFLAKSEPQNNVNSDYDSAIFNFVVDNVCYPLLKYHSGVIDGGQRFNWVHPLTRFYFLNADFNKSSQ